MFRRNQANYSASEYANFLFLMSTVYCIFLNRIQSQKQTNYLTQDNKPNYVFRSYVPAKQSYPKYY